MNDDSEIRQKEIQRMIGILKSLDIQMEVNGCGCCGSPDVEFYYKGELICSGSNVVFSTNEDIQQ